MLKLLKKVLLLSLSTILVTNLFLTNTTKVFAAEKPIIFKLAFTDPPYVKAGDTQLVHQSYAGMLAFKSELERLSAGKIEVQLYPNGTLGDAKSNIEQILAGNLQGATPADGALSPFYKNIQVFSIPYIFNSPLQAYKVLDGSFGQDLFNDMAKTSGLRVLSSYDNGGFRNFTNSKKEIKTAADLKGLKIRTMDIPVHMEMVKALGASPTPVAWLELYSALQSGVVDAQENSPITTLGGSLQEVQKYCTLDGHILGLAFIVTSESWLKSLPADLQKDVIQAGEIATIAARGTSRANDSLALAQLKASGVKVYSPTAAELETFKVAQAPCITWLKANTNATYVDELISAVKGTDTNTNTNNAAANNNNTKSASQNFNMVYILGGIFVVIILLYFISRKKKGSKTDTK